MVALDHRRLRPPTATASAATVDDCRSADSRSLRYCTRRQALSSSKLFVRRTAPAVAAQAAPARCRSAGNPAHRVRRARPGWWWRRWWWRRKSPTGADPARGRRGIRPHHIARQKAGFRARCHRRSHPSPLRRCPPWFSMPGQWRRGRTIRLACRSAASHSAPPPDLGRAAASAKASEPALDRVADPVSGKAAAAAPVAASIVPAAA